MRGYGSPEEPICTRDRASREGTTVSNRSVHGRRGRAKVRSKRVQSRIELVGRRAGVG